VKNIVTAIFLFFILINCCLTANLPGERFEFTEATNTTEPQIDASTEIPTLTKTVKPTATSTHTQSPTETPTKTVTKTQLPTATLKNDSTQETIPGITTAYIKSIMEEQNFECEIAYSPINSDPYYKWECRREDLNKSMLLEMWATSFSSVTLVRTRIIQFSSPSVNVAINYLGFISTLPYDGSNPQKAKEWVEDTIPKISGDGDVRETIIGNVKFQLYGSSSNYSLKIGNDL